MSYINKAKTTYQEQMQETNKQTKTPREIHKYLIWKNFVVIIKFPLLYLLTGLHIEGVAQTWGLVLSDRRLLKGICYLGRFYNVT